MSALLACDTSAKLWIGCVVVVERDEVEIPAPEGGWLHPWDNVEELAVRLSPADFTLVGGLMVQAHAAAAGIEGVRPTVDVDIVVHLETQRGRAQHVHDVVTGLGYHLKSPHVLGALSGTDQAHRYERGDAAQGLDVLDVMRADHAAPRVVERLAGHSMLPIDGATQALRRTVNARLHISTERETIVSIPEAYGALLLKSAAHMADSRDAGRHLRDAVVLLACIDDPFAVAERPRSQSDGRRLLHLGRELFEANPSAWLVLDRARAEDARANLGILLDHAAG